MYQLIFSKGSPTSDKFCSELENIINKKDYDMECSFIDLLDSDKDNLSYYPNVTPRLTKIFPLPEEVFVGELKDIQSWLDKTASK
ncbi:hypothetical protein MRY82_06050 [bacterium]|nr:hypothetical protein [bacterium]